MSEAPCADPVEPVPERISVSGICFGDVDFDELGRLWSAVGARRGSFLGRMLESEDESAAGRALSTSGCQLESICHRFFSGGPVRADPLVWADERRKLNAIIDTAARLGGRSVYLLTGGIGQCEWEQAADIFAAAVGPCVDHAAAAGVALMVENSDVRFSDLHFVHTLRDAVTLSRLSGVGVCIDLIGCWAESGLRESILQAVPRCDLVQVSDHVPGDRSAAMRAVPGDGGVPLERLVRDILGAGYTGVFELELFGPRVDAEGPIGAVRRGARHLGEILTRAGR